MEQPWWITVVLAIVAAVFGSGGFWAYVSKKAELNNKKTESLLIEQKAQQEKAVQDRMLQSQMLLGLGHDRIVYLGMNYIERGWITHDEYENLNDYLFLPYKQMGGNGTAQRVMEEVAKLPFKPNGFKD